MEIIIKGTAYPLRFGMGFLRDLDALAKRQLEPGIYKNVGFLYTAAALIDGDLDALETVLLTANKTEQPRLSRDILDAHLEDPATDLDALQAEVKDFLSKANVCRPKMKELQALVSRTEAK